MMHAAGIGSLAPENLDDPAKLRDAVQTVTLLALRAVGVSVREWDADAGLLERLRTDRPDAVVIALHGG